MSAPAARINPVQGEPPELVFASPSSLRIDPSYQRDMAAKSSQALVRHIAENWDWRLCQPLIVARRVDFIERLFVIDGQHRLAAARLRGDIGELPCVIGSFDGVAGEAAGFVALNARRRALTALDMFKAATASGDEQALLVIELLADAGLELAPHTNVTAWKPGQVANIAGIRKCLRVFGEASVRAGLRTFAQAFSGQVLRYAGTIIGGVIAVCYDELQLHDDPLEQLERLQTLLARRSQTEWRSDAMRARVDFPGLRYDTACALAMRRAWAAYSGGVVPAEAIPAEPAKPALIFAAPSAAPSVSGQKRPAGQGGWCDQCDMKVTAAQAASCRSRFCSFGKV